MLSLWLPARFLRYAPLTELYKEAGWLFLRLPALSALFIGAAISMILESAIDQLTKRPSDKER